MRSINIGKRYKPFIIAELSGNHNGSINNAIKSIKAAADCGVDAIKLQTYTADTMTINSKKKDFLIKNKHSLWNGYSLYDLYKKAHTPWSWHKKLFNEAKKNGLIYFSTPFDESSINFLKQFKLPLYKVSSFENTDLRLIKLLARTKKPLIISLGLASLRQISEAIKTAKNNGAKKIILLKCTSDYPASNKNINLETIKFLKKKFKCEIGFSDHTKGIGAAVAAVANGATVIEKHFTHNKNVKSVDVEFSLGPSEMKSLVEETKNAWESQGKVKFSLSKSEKSNLKFRRSIYVIKKIKKGEKFSKQNLKCIRPGYGLNTKFFEKIINLKARKNIDRGTALKWNLIKR